MIQRNGFLSVMVALLQSKFTTVVLYNYEKLLYKYCDSNLQYLDCNFTTTYTEVSYHFSDFSIFTAKNFQSGRNNYTSLHGFVME